MRGEDSGAPAVTVLLRRFDQQTPQALALVQFVHLRETLWPTLVWKSIVLLGESERIAPLFEN